MKWHRVGDVAMDLVVLHHTSGVPRKPFGVDEAVEVVRITNCDDDVVAVALHIDIVERIVKSRCKNGIVSCCDVDEESHQQRSGCLPRYHWNGWLRWGAWTDEPSEGSSKFKLSRTVGVEVFR